MLSLARFKSSIFAIILFLLVTIPSLGMMLFGAQSMAAGLLSISIGIIFFFAAIFWSYPFNKKFLFDLRIYWLFVFCIIFIGHFFLVLGFSKNFDFLKASGSFFVLAIVIMGAFSFSKIAFYLNVINIHYNILTVFYILTALGFFALIGISPVGAASHALPVIVYMEPSHFALAYIPFAAYSVIVSKGYKKIFLFALVLFLGFFIKSTTIMAGLLIITFCAFRRMQIVSIFLILIFLIPFVDFNYFLERLIFDFDNVTNTSTLAFLQGWDRAYRSLLDTNFLGIGFQQFGIFDDGGDFQEIILKIAGDYLNMMDGGTTAAKIVGEFGLLGVIFILVYIYFAFSIFIEIRKNTKKIETSSLKMFANICIISFSVEMFVRGLGYFTPGLWLLFFGVIVKFSHRNRHGLK